MAQHIQQIMKESMNHSCVKLIQENMSSFPVSQ